MKNTSFKNAFLFGIVGIGIVVLGMLVFFMFPPTSYTQPLNSTPSAFAHLPFIRNDRGHTAPTPTATPLPVPAGAYLETFDGDPTSPQPWQDNGWDVTVHSRDRETWYNLLEMDGAHGSDCAAPPATHAFTAYEDAVYQCKNHTMSAIYATGYGLIYLTPDHMVDFSQGEAVIRVDVSTLRASGRDWIDFYISPYEDNLQLALIDWLPDLSGDPKRAIHIQMDIFDQGTGLGRFKAYVINNFSVSSLPVESTIPYDDVLDPSPTKREIFEIRISQDHLTFGMPEYDLWWVDTDMPPLNWTQGVVQLGHHSYNPKKACNYDGSCGPTSWHWDNVFISPAVPFTMIQANRRYVNPDHTTINLSAPAPANAHLRFAGIGSSLEVSFNGGQTWQDAQVKEQEEYDSGSFWSYWTPIPAGTTSVRFRGEDWWGGDWHVRDITVWSPESSTQSSNFTVDGRDVNDILFDQTQTEQEYCVIPTAND